ncbi:MAG: hypothetical protein QG646_2550 [Euryarchaeota archaeon]|nr:hypothetical protein [Euryarchaeota archaeon]
MEEKRSLLKTIVLHKKIKEFASVAGKAWDSVLAGVRVLYL